MVETLDRSYILTTNDTFSSANTLIYTATTTETVTGIITNNNSSNSIDVELVVDIGGTGATFRNVIPKAITLGAKTGLPVPGFVVLSGDKVRARASSSSYVEVYLSRVKS